MKFIDLLRSIIRHPLPPDATITSEEFVAMRRAGDQVIARANNISTEILKLESALRAQR